MPLQDALKEWLAKADLGVSLEEIIDDHGYGDLPPETISTALQQFASQASLPVADALAPVVTRLSDVPFEPGDLPDAPEIDAALADGRGVYDLLEGISVDGSDLGAEFDDADPVDFDDILGDFDELDEFGHAPGPVAADPTDTGDDGDDSPFGSGDETGEHDAPVGALDQVVASVTEHVDGSPADDRVDETADTLDEGHELPGPLGDLVEDLDLGAPFADDADPADLDLE
ncbi:MAG: hypothetical protein ACFCVK_00395 [Acidimicrobiales bacterium]